MSLKKLLLGSSLVLVVLLLSGCITDSSSSKQGTQVEQQQNIYVDNQPLPAFDWSLERHVFIELYKARNKAVNTYSYVRNFNGQVIFSCKSIGFPLAFNMQLTNPESVQYSNGYREVLPQPEPNGLYSSPSTSGTYIFCLNSDGTISPSYFEADVETHLAPLKADGSGLASDSELKISTKK